MNQVGFRDLCSHPLNRYLTLLLPVSNPFCYYLVPFNTKHFTNLPPDTILLNDDLMDDEMLMLMEEERATLKQQLAACCLRTTDILCVWHCCWVGVLTLTRIMSEFRIQNSSCETATKIETHFYPFFQCWIRVQELFALLVFDPFVSIPFRDPKCFSFAWSSVLID